MDRRGLARGLLLVIPIVLAGGPPPVPSQPARSGGGLAREEAVDLLRAFFRARGIDSPGLNDHNLGGVDLGGERLWFEYVPDRRVLVCRALIYRFREPPKPGVLEGFKDEETVKRTDTGGGTVEYMPENQGLFLSRAYAARASERQFSRDMERLLRASRRWADEVLERVANRVFGHK